VAHHKSAIKRHRQNEKRRLQNRVVKTRMKTVTKKLVQAEKSARNWYRRRNPVTPRPF